MRILIHRGSNEIGGTCIELSTGGTTIWLDVGLPLTESENARLPVGRPDAVIISHPHQDHFGLLDGLDPNIPVHIGQAAVRLMNAARIFTSRPVYKNNFKVIERDRSLTVGGFRITPLLVDHSAVDAFSLFIEAEDKRVLYSGDFRGHGRKSMLFEQMLRHPTKNIDVLLLEGTMLGRENGKFPDESSVEDAIKQVIDKQENITFVISSSQNIDRLVSVYRACKPAKKTLVLDFYTAWVLEQLDGITKSVPRMKWDNVAVYADHIQNEVLKSNRDIFGDFTRRAYNYRVRPEEIRANPAQYVWWSKMSRYRRIKSFAEAIPVNVIYSQWLGYLDRPSAQYKGSEQISALRDDQAVNFCYAHTSGHATLQDLQAFARAINPNKLVPVHTEHGDEYEKYFTGVVRLRDGEELMLN